MCLQHEMLREEMLSWYCHQPEHDVTTAACEVRLPATIANPADAQSPCTRGARFAHFLSLPQLREFRKALAVAKTEAERVHLNEEHKRHGMENKFRTTTPLYEIFRAYCRRASIRRHHTRAHRRCNSRS